MAWIPVVAILMTSCASAHTAHSQPAHQTAHAAAASGSLPPVNQCQAGAYLYVSNILANNASADSAQRELAAAAQRFGTTSKIYHAVAKVTSDSSVMQQVAASSGHSLSLTITNKVHLDIVQSCA